MVLLANLFILLVCEYFPRTVLQLAEPVGIDGHVGINLVATSRVDEH